MTTDTFSEFLQSSPRIILGSGSSSRRKIMDELCSVHGFAYEVVTADIDEKSIRLPEPETLVMKLAHAKADAIVAKLRSQSGLVAGGAQSGYLITCDQVVVHEGNILEKPEDAEEARRFIGGYGRAPASTVGSVLCTDLASGDRFGSIDVAKIHFQPIPRETTEALIAEGNVMWCRNSSTNTNSVILPCRPSRSTAPRPELAQVVLVVLAHSCRVRNAAAR